MQMPWWCYARADALLNLSAQAWALVRKSRLSMAYIGAESPSDCAAQDIRKGTKTDQTLAVGRTVPQQRRHPRTVLHAGAAAGSGRRNRADLRVHSRDEACQSRIGNHRCTSTRRCPPTSCRPIRARAPPRALLAGRARRSAAFSAKRRRNGPSNAGSTTPATPTRHGSPSDCAGASTISSPCWAAAFPPSGRALPGVGQAD